MIKIYILAQTQEDNLVFKFVSSSLGVSNLFTQKGCQGDKNGNPYIVYRKELLTWLQKSNLDINQTELVVCDVISGNI